MLAVRRRLGTKAPESEFDALYRQVWPRAVSSARRIVNDTAVAEELAQEAFTRAFERWRSVSRHPCPTAWILRVTLNLAISESRRGRPPPTAESTTGYDDHVVLGVVVRDGLARLSAKQRQALVLRYIGGCEETEIAEAMGISTGTVKTHLSRGREQLAGLIGPRADELLASDVGP